MRLRLRKEQVSEQISKSESGAVTVDWVVLTAAIIGLGIAIATTVGDSTEIPNEDHTTTTSTK